MILLRPKKSLQTMAIAAIFLFLFVDSELYAKSRKPDVETRFIESAITKVDNGKISKGDLVKLKKYSRENKKALVILARYYRRCENNPAKALEVAGQILLDKKDFSDWRKTKRLGRKIDNFFPSVDKWKISEETAEIVSEAAMALSDAGYSNDAMKVCDKLGLSFDGVLRLIAHETYGDIQIALSNYDQAIKCLDAGVIYAKSYRYDKTAEFNYVLSRIKNKLSFMNRLKSVPEKMRWYNPDLTEEGMFLVQALQEIDNRTFTEKGFKKLKDLSRFNRDGIKQRTTALIARYYRAGEKNPTKALSILAPTILGRAKAGEWFKAYNIAYQKALREYNSHKKPKSSVNEAEILHPSERLLADFPETEEWVIDENTAGCATEAALCFVDFGKIKKASEVLDTVKTKMKTVPYVVAIEAVGDLFFANGNFSKSISFYDHSLKMLPHLLVNRDGYTIKDSTGEVGHLTTRIRKAVAESKKYLEMEKYGKGFILYKQCNILRMEKKDYISAYLKYKALEQEFPKTVYSEAAKAYRIKCLLALTDRNEMQKIEELIVEKENVLKKKYLELKALKQRNAMDVFEKELETKMELHRKTLAEIKTVPVGAKALQAAENMTARFIKENEYGLYRGEVLLDMANCHLEKKFDIANAEKWYKRCSEWFDKAKASDSRLAAFKIPDKAKAVSAPPPTERSKDFWANINLQHPESGDLFNRNTCQWYCGYIKKQAVIKLGFIAYCDRRIEEAGELFGQLYELDPYFRKNEARSFGSVVSRMKWNIKHNKGCIYATPAEMNVFTNRKRRFAVMLGDMYMEEENHKKAFEIYSMLLKGKFGGVSKNEAAYLTYVAASCHVMLAGGGKGKREAVRILGKFDNEFKSSPTRPRALLLRGAWLTSDISYPDDIAAGIEDFKTIVKKYPRSKDAGFALHHWGSSLEMIKKYNEAEKVFQAYLRKYPEKGSFTSLVKKKLINLAAIKKNNSN